MTYFLQDGISHAVVVRPFGFVKVFRLVEEERLQFLLILDVLNGHLKSIREFYCSRLEFLRLAQREIILEGKELHSSWHIIKELLE